jgi:hypothetical protein
MAETETQTPNQTALRRPVIQYAETKEKRERITKTMGVMLVTVALSINAFVALLNFLVIGEFFISSIILSCADLIFIIWFWMLGVSFTKNPKNLAAMGIQAIIGLVPLINTLPELTLGILAIVLMTRAEDKGGLLGKAANLAQTKIKV